MTTNQKAAAVIRSLMRDLRCPTTSSIPDIRRLNRNPLQSSPVRCSGSWTQPRYCGQTGKESRPMNFEPYQRKVHLFRDQKGATYKSMGAERMYADTLCKMNSRDPEIQLTTVPGEVTCRTCLRKLGRSAPELVELTPEKIAELRKAYSKTEDIVRVIRVLEYVGERAAVERVLQQNAVKGFVDFGPVTIREAMLPFPEKLS